MRYYRYGSKDTQQDVEVSEQSKSNVTGRFGDLVIDEDTVYEIDEECLRCQKEKQS